MVHARIHQIKARLIFCRHQPRMEKSDLGMRLYTVDGPRFYTCMHGFFICLHIATRDGVRRNHIRSYKDSGFCFHKFKMRNIAIAIVSYLPIMRP